MRIAEFKLRIERIYCRVQEGPQLFKLAINHRLGLLKLTGPNRPINKAAAEILLTLFLANTSSTWQ
ncbi:hypothetical protein D0Y50_09680 [Salinimonas sediminis]|uniref:Uncharacterized protein n=1 Tax=Salinimonas sediminis TaxID=2303538 RepID=A0A346NM59_9ALTE|nr:hypothetical protein D0Y50_09680 [Salinimonas sediminis]